MGSGSVTTPCGSSPTGTRTATPGISAFPLLGSAAEGGSFSYTETLVFD